MTSGSLNLQIDDDYGKLMLGLNPNESLMIIRNASDRGFDFVGRNYVVWNKIFNWEECACSSF